MNSKIDNPFVYGFRIVVPANGTANPQITISSDSDFELFEMRGNVQAQGAITIQPSYSNGVVWSNYAFDAALISAGANANNKVLPAYPIKIPANTQLNFLLTNTTGGDLTYEFQLWGRKIPKGMQ